ncbi:MAG: vitamin B12 dependent-methionine synthase activation domain-containing protein [Thermodesulfobacteriota bacterium]
MRVLDSIPIQLDLKEVKRQLRLNKKMGYSADVRELVGIAESLIKAKAVYEVSYIRHRGEDTVEFDGVTFTSRVLRVNLDEVERVFPFIITIGSALEDNASSSGDLLRQFYLETMGDMALRSSRQYLEKYLKRNFGLGQLSRMNPGSLKDWPVTEQKPLFSLFGNVEELIGVTLTESMLMIPRKSVSGIFFPTEVMFFNCQLCSRKGCLERKAPYDEALTEKYGLKDE